MIHQSLPIPISACPTPGPMMYFGDGGQIDAYHFTQNDLPPHLIGRGLARIARFSGAGLLSVSVAQHSKNLSHLVGPCIHRQRAALMHDVPELFTGDVPSPIKVRCSHLLAIDDCIINRIAFVYDIPLWAFEAIKDKDSRISYDERLFMFPDLSDRNRKSSEANKLGIHIVPVSPDEAAAAWTRRFYQLFVEQFDA